MTTTQKFLASLESVQSAAGSSETAYLVRSRLSRTLLDCARLATSACGLRVPELLDEWPSLGDAPPSVRAVATKCQELRAKTKHFCQPSEAFDTRWRENWLSIENDLELLRTLVLALDDVDTPAISNSQQIRLDV